MNKITLNCSPWFCIALFAAVLGVGCGPITTPLEHAYASRLPSVPIMPSSRGIANVWGRANVATTQDGIGTAPALSVYSPAVEVGAGVGFRVSRFMEIRVMGDVALSDGAADAYGNGRYPGIFAGGVGPGLVIGWSSEDSTWSLQLTFDTAFTFHGHRGTDVTVFEPHVLTASGGSLLSLQPRGTVAFGYRITHWLRLYAQLGAMGRAQWNLAGTQHHDPLGLGQVGVEMHYKDVSVLVDVQYVAFDPLFDRGPILELAVRGVFGDGPGSRARTPFDADRERRRAYRRAARREREQRGRE